MPTSPQAEAMLERMMERSELRIECAAHDEAVHVAQAAGRLLETAYAWQQWSTSHRLLLGQIARQPRPASQARAIKAMALSMIHRKAPFEFLRDQQVRGAARHQFLRDVFGSSDYAHTVVREHRNYITALCTYVCVDTLCAPASMRRIRDYERCYSDFWRARAQACVGATDGSRNQHELELLSWLRGEVQVARQRVLDSGPSRADELTLEELRRPTGDTVRLRVPPRASWQQGLG
jgi:hypothetical protein